MAESNLDYLDNERTRDIDRQAAGIAYQKSGITIIPCRQCEGSGILWGSRGVHLPSYRGIQGICPYCDGNGFIEKVC